MWSPKTLVLLSFTIFLSSAQAAGLIQALQESGASDFAAEIQSDATLSSVYLSGSVQTVFAPLNNNPSHRKTKRQGSNPIALALYHGMTNLNTLGGMSKPPGLSLPSNDGSANLNGQNQSAVSNPSNTPPSNVPKRWDNVTLPSLLKVYSGLGNSVNIIKADITYDGGLIHIIDDFFTLPQPLSATANANGHTTFTSLANSAGLGATLDSTPAITCFIPSNAAFAASNSTSGYPSFASLISGHVIPNFLGYLPSLTNGTSFTTQAGSIVTVTIQGSDFFLNNAKIVASNQITENGVAHVLNEIIQPVFPAPPPSTTPAPLPSTTAAPPPPPPPSTTPAPPPTSIPSPTPTTTPTPTIVPFKGKGSSMAGGSTQFAMAVGSFLLFLAVDLLI